MTGPVDYRARAEGYARAHGEMTPLSVDTVVALCAEDVVFHDPFNDTVGRADLRQVFTDMFQSARDPRTGVLTLYGGGRDWIIKWRFTAGLPVIGDVDVLGLTELTLNEAGLVTSHLDYWDSGPAIYGQLPLVGGIVRWVRGRLSAQSRR